MEQVLVSAKALVAAVLVAVVTWLNTEFSVEWWGQLLIVVLGAVAVWLTPNQSTDEPDDPQEFA